MVTENVNINRWIFGVAGVVVSSLLLWVASTLQEVRDTTHKLMTDATYSKEERTANAINIGRATEVLSRLDVEHSRDSVILVKNSEDIASLRYDQMKGRRFTYSVSIVY